MQHTTKIAFTNHLMFNAVLTENEDLCARLIGEVLGATVESIEYLDDETTVQPTLDGRGARLDVLALIDGEYVDIEMQVGAEPDIARRCRFYHSAIATRYMPKGTGYSSVPRSYVIFICLSDPLGLGRARYELKTSCPKIPSLVVDDGATSILLNAQAWQLEENPEVAGMLNYALTGAFENGLAGEIARAVEGKNLDRRWVKASMGVMTYEHELIVLNHALEQNRAELDAAKSRLDAAQSELAARQSELADTQSELADTQSELATAQSELADTQSELATRQSELADTQSELAAARAKESAIRKLSKLLRAENRTDDYFAALDDDQLMDALLEEFHLS